MPMGQEHHLHVALSTNVYMPDSHLLQVDSVPEWLCILVLSLPCIQSKAGAKGRTIGVRGGISSLAAGAAGAGS